jgi:two-component system LytT family response regulator
MIKALIVDDEPKARNVLNHYLVNFIQQDFEIRQAESVGHAMEILDKFIPDVVFLDIEMPGQNGFELLIARKNPTYDIIFTTAYNQYAIQAIRFSALDYLLKPVDPDELQTAVNRHLERTNTNLPRKNSCCMTTWLQTSGKAKSKIFGWQYLPTGAYISSTSMKSFGLKQTKTILVSICWAKSHFCPVKH